ncbi:hypothetical protein L0668_19095 [Paraglaciecola aquimarina]|uniref:Uncharacterized protein n=1 Tax=Paraglaciecola algarum TaxID=3050085 RepID=A0ABS9DB85_9ALTE|nr:hypothetical protein [Paraglaciecola sp. G1-23]MCF2950223.1 hypothetical protein [Paraglaciecola sp. G1-23]
MSDSPHNTEGTIKQEKTNISAVQFSVQQLFFALIGTLGVVISTIVGAGWYMYTQGVFNPDEEARRAASEARYGFEKAQADLVAARTKIESLNAKLSESGAAIASLEAGLELKKSELDFHVNQNTLVTQIIVACINATTAGEESEEATATAKPGQYNYAGGAGTAAAAAAITAVVKAQSGSRVTADCAKVFSEKIEPLLKRTAN